MKSFLYRSRYFILGILIICVVVGASFISYKQGASSTVKTRADAPDASTHTYPPKSFPRNKAGLTYGSSSDTEYGDEPDLIAVEATNGKMGYILKVDLQELDRSGVQNLDEAIRSSTSYNEKASKAFIETLAQEIGFDVNVISSNQALSAYEELCLATPMQMQGGDIAAKIEKDLGLGRNYNISEDVLLRAALSAQDAVAQTIPVYKMDGKTKIGDFEVY